MQFSPSSDLQLGGRLFRLSDDQNGLRHLGDLVFVGNSEIREAPSHATN
jgi:hypothetical protein